VAWKITRPEPLGLLLETHEGTYLQGLAIWHGRLVGGKTVCCYDDHCCRHCMTGASQYSTMCGHMLARCNYLLQHTYPVLYMACQHTICIMEYVVPSHVYSKADFVCTSCHCFHIK
jgi:hypothetical protein